MIVKLGGYATVGDKGNKMTHYFCKTCGTSLFASTGVTGGEKVTGGKGGWASAEWVISTSALDRSEGLYDLVGHEYLSSTLDGGMANWLPELNGKPMGLWLESSDEPESQIGKLHVFTAEDKMASAQAPSLLFRCHCKANSLFVPPPVQPSNRSSLPYWLAAPLSIPSDDASASNDLLPLRRRGKLCACGDCTRSSGVAYPAAVWVDVPHNDMFADEALTRTLAQGESTGATDTFVNYPGMTRYDSTLGKTARYFCSTCGAKILLLANSDPTLARISASLIDPTSTSSDGRTIKHGTLAPVHIAWWAGANVCQSVADMGLEDSMDPELGTRMAEGLAKWVKEVQGGDGKHTARQEKETARKGEARRDIAALGDD